MADHAASQPRSKPVAQTTGNNGTMKMTVDQVFALITSWSKKIATLALVLFLAITLLKVFGFTLPILQVASMGWQELGVFAAGVSYALRG